MKYYKIISIILILLVLLFLLSHFYLSIIVESFTNNNSWSDNLKQRFLAYQKTMNKNDHNFNLDILQKQVNSKEVENYLQSGYWNWPDSLIKDFLIDIGNNKMIKYEPGVALNYSMRLYNQQAISNILAWNTKEGKLLLYGIDLGATDEDRFYYHRDSLPHNSIKCATDSNGNSYMEKTEFNGIDKLSGYPIEKKTRLNPVNLTNQIPGFSFVKDKCDPCVALDGNYSCPFNINTNSNKNNEGISSIWRKLWKL